MRFLKRFFPWPDAVRVVVFSAIFAINVYLMLGIFGRNHEPVVIPTPQSELLGSSQSLPPVEPESVIPPKEATLKKVKPPGKEIEWPVTLAIPPALRKVYAKKVNVDTDGQLSNDIIQLLQLDEGAASRINQAYGDVLREQINQDIAALQIELNDGVPQLVVGSVDTEPLLGKIGEAGDVIADEIADAETRELLVASLLNFGDIRGNQLIPEGAYRVSSKNDILVLTPVKTVDQTQASDRKLIRLPLNMDVAAYIASESGLARVAK